MSWLYEKGCNQNDQSGDEYTVMELKPGETMIEPSISHTIKLFKLLGNKRNLDILKILSNGPKTYTGLHADLKTTSKGMMAFCLRKLKHENMITLNRLHQTYDITFKGLKSLELVSAAESLANLNISNPETNITIKLAQNQNWLEPLIKQYLTKEAVGQ